MKAQAKNKDSSIKQTHLINFILLVGIIIFINIMGGIRFTRLDFTAEKRYSLSDSTKNMLRNLDDIVYLKVYLEGDFPSGFKRLRNSTREILDEFRAYSKGKVQYEFINPFEDPNPEVQNRVVYQLIEQGLQPTNIELRDGEGTSKKLIFPGAIMSYREKEVPIQLLKSQFNRDPELVLNESIEFLEYELSAAIYRLKMTHIRKTVAFSEGHGELDKRKTADFKKELENFYKVERIEILNDLESIGGDVKTLIIAKPDSFFNDASKYIIDQFIMRGGRVLWLIDNVFASMDSIRNDRSYTVAVPHSLNLDDQLFRYGVRINTDLLLDAQCGKIPIVTGYYGNQLKTELKPWYYFPIISSRNQHILVNNINNIRMEFVSSIDTITVPDVKKTILLQTSDLTKVVKTPARVALATFEQAATKENFNRSNIPVAVLLEGQFTSLYKNRLVPKLTLDKKFAHRENSIYTKMIVVSDGDIAKNAFDIRQNQVYPMGYDRVTGSYYSGNKNFLMNAVNYLSDDGWLVPLRSKEFKIRLLDKQKLNKDKKKWTYINTFLPILSVILLGLIYLPLRKRKFAK